MQKKIDRVEKTLSIIGEWIRAADQKASILLALQGIIVTLFIQGYLQTLTARFQTCTISWWNGILVLLATFSLVWSIIESIWVIIPRIANKAKSHLYFGGIKNMTLTQYTTDMKDMTEKEYFDELCEQVHTNSKITITKHQKTQGAIVWFLVGLGLFIVSYVSLKFF